MVNVVTAVSTASSRPSVTFSQTFSETFQPRPVVLMSNARSRLGPTVSINVAPSYVPPGASPRAKPGAGSVSHQVKLNK